MTKNTLKKVTKKEFLEFLMNYNGRKYREKNRIFEEEGIYIHEYSGNYIYTKDRDGKIYSNFPETIAKKIFRSFLGVPYNVKYFIKESKE